MQKITRQTMIDFATTEVSRGSIYVWGAQGQRGSQITENWIKACETSTTNANRAIALWKKNKEKYDPNMIAAFDCSGLIGACLNVNGNPGYDDTADGYRKSCTAINKSQLQPGDFVFEWNGKKSGHIGIFIGDGKVAEARGRDYGVVITELDKREWKKYGRPDFIYSDGDTTNPAPTPVVDEDIKYELSRTLYKKSPIMTGEDVKHAQILLDKHRAEPGDIDGEFGSKTEAATIRFQKARIAEGYDLGSSGADGQIGEKTWTVLGGIWTGKKGGSSSKPSTPAAPSGGSSSSLPDKIYYYRIKTNQRTYFRNGFNTSSTIIKTLNANTNLRYRGTYGDYYKVSIDDGSGQIGYVASRLTTNNYLAKSDDIKAIQKAVGVTQDGIYGKSTADAVGKKQKAAGIAQDCIYGPNTKKVL